MRMKEEEEIILKARVTTLEGYLQDVFTLLKNMTESAQLTREKVKSKRREFREAMDHQNRVQSELEK